MGGIVLSVEHVFRAALTLLVSIIGWFALNVYNEAQATKADFNDFKVMVSRDYVRRDDLSDIKATLVRIEQKVDLKADKTR